LIAALLSGGQIDSRAATPEVVATMPDVLNINASMAQKELQIRVLRIFASVNPRDAVNLNAAALLDQNEFNV